MYINQTTKPIITGLKAPRMSIQNFKDMIFSEMIKDKDLIEQKYISNCCNQAPDVEIDTKDSDWLDKFKKLYDDPRYSDNIYDIIERYIHSVSYLEINKDADANCINFSNENSNYQGFEITKSGIPFFLCSGWGDGESGELCYLYYWDGKDFRFYVPIKGNLYNPLTKDAIGTWGGYCDENYKPYGSNLSILSKDEMDDYMTGDFRYVMTQVYPNEVFKHLPTEDNIKLYEKILNNDLEIDYSSCKEDFESIIEEI